MSFVRNVLRSVRETAEMFFPFEELLKKEIGLTHAQYENLLRLPRGLGDMINIRYYDEYEGEIGIYTTSDERIGFILQIEAPPFLGSATEKTLDNFLQTIGQEGVAVHILTITGRNLDQELDSFKEDHHCNIDVKNVDNLRDMVDYRYQTLRRWTEESMMTAPGLDIRLRKITNLVSILLPYGADMQSAKEMFSAAKMSLETLMARNFNANKLITLLREFLVPDAICWDSALDKRIELPKQIAYGAYTKLNDDGSISFGKEGWHAKVLVPTKLPEKISLGEFQDLFFDRLCKLPTIPLPCPFILSMSILFDEIRDAKDKAKAKARWDGKQIRFLGVKDREENPLLYDRKNECVDVIEAIDKFSEIPLSCKFTITVFEKDQRKMSNCVNAIKRNFALANYGGFSLMEEKFSSVALLNFLYSLPLHFLYSVKGEVLGPRYDTLLRMHTTWITPVIGDHKGFGRNTGMVGIGRTGQLQFIDFRSAINSNVVITAPPGGGKSSMLGEIQIFHGLSRGEYIRFFDKGGSNRAISETVGGKFIEFTETSNVCLNFFTFLETSGKAFDKDLGKEVEIIHEDELATIIPMLGYMCKVDLKSSASSNKDAQNDIARSYLSSIFEEAVQGAFSRRGREAGMKELVENLKIIRDKLQDKGEDVGILNQCINSMSPYADETKRAYKYFNNPNNINLDNAHVTFESAGLDGKDDMYMIAQMAMMQRVSTEAMRRLREPKMVIVDEAKPLLKDTIMVSFLEEFALRIRKYGGVFIVVTQSAQHYSVNPTAKSIYDAANWKIFLQHDKGMIDSLVKENHINMSDFQKEIFGSVRMVKGEYNEALILSGNSTMVTRLKFDPLSQWMFGADQDGQNMIAKVMESFLLERSEAIFFLAEKTRYMWKIEDEKILLKINDKRKRMGKPELSYKDKLVTNENVQAAN